MTKLLDKQPRLFKGITGSWLQQIRRVRTQEKQEKAQRKAQEKQRRLQEQRRERNLKLLQQKVAEYRRKMHANRPRPADEERAAREPRVFSGVGSVLRGSVADRKMQEQDLSVKQRIAQKRAKHRKAAGRRKRIWFISGGGANGTGKRR